MKRAGAVAYALSSQESWIAPFSEIDVRLSGLSSCRRSSTVITLLASLSVPSVLTAVT